MTQYDGHGLWRILPLALLVAAAALSPVSAQHAHGGGSHSGMADMPGMASDWELSKTRGRFTTLTREFLVESVFLSRELRIRIWDLSHHPLSMKAIAGTATVQHQNGKSERVVLEHVAASDDEQTYLRATYPFWNLDEGRARVTVIVEALPGSSEKSLRLWHTFRGVAEDVTPAHHMSR